jgi:uncharacterized protein (UPF0210 family)
VKIRSITAFETTGDRPRPAVLAEAGKFLQAARRVMVDLGVEVQTIRLALELDTAGLASLPEVARDVEEACVEVGIEYVSLGLVPTRRLSLVPDVIAATGRVFVSTPVATGRTVDWQAVRAAAQTIQAIGRDSPDGFGNLRFAAVAGCPPHGPFFPSAFHDGGGPAVSIALQAADLVNAAIGGHTSISDAPTVIAHRFDEATRPIEAAARRLARRRGRRYAGIDVSPAPFPDAETSLGAAIEALSRDRLGRPGTVAAAAAITRGLRATTIQRAGFSGLMLPVLEDAVLAERTIDGSLGIRDLLLYSTVCGCGLDTVPLPGEVPQDALASLIGDVATLAVALDKPLTARLMPLPGKRIGELTEFDFPYFVNGRVLDPSA